MGIYEGTDDTLAFPEESRYVRDNLKDLVKEYLEVEGGHNSHFIRSDTTYIKVNMINMVKKYNSKEEKI